MTRPSTDVFDGLNLDVASSTTIDDPWGEVMSSLKPYLQDVECIFTERQL